MLIEQSAPIVPDVDRSVAYGSASGYRGSKSIKRLAAVSVLTADEGDG